MPDQQPKATPDRELRELRAAQHRDRQKEQRIEERIKHRQERIDALKANKHLLDNLARAQVRNPSLVLAEADRASQDNDIPETEFRAMCLTILKKETGLPQRAVFGCDHGAQGGHVPFCGDEVNHVNGLAFITALHANPYGVMNGVHWTQTTWFEKVYRVQNLSPDLTSAGAHMRVCFGDLAILRDAYGVRDAFRRYNGAGDAAEAYAAQAMAWLPDMLKLVQS